MLKNPSNSLHSSINSNHSEPKTNFILKNIQNVTKKQDTEDLIQINCINDVKPCDSSVEIYEEIETIETNDPNFLVQGDQCDTDDQVNIESDTYDRSRIRSQFSNVTKRVVHPELIDSGYDTSKLETVTLKIQSDLDLKLTNVMKQIEMLKMYENELVPRLLDKRKDVHEDTDRLRHLELVQENQFKLMSQLIEKLEPDSKLARIEEPKVKTIQFKDTVEVFEPKKKIKSRSRSKSKSSRKSSCETCDRSKSPKRSPKRKEFLQELIETIPKSPNISLIEVEKPNLFDEFLTKKDSNLTEILKQSNELLSELERQEEINAKIKEELSRNVKPSMFSDIKEVLKKVEESKSKIDRLMDELNRKKSNKMFYLVNNGNDESEDMRINKLVDGCINAIQNDVQKIVTQKMIDESKHVKLIAERDTKRVTRSVSTSNLPSTTNKKQISDVHKYLGKIYGKSLLDQIKMEEIEEKKRKIREEAERKKKKIELEKSQKSKPVPESGLMRPAFVSKPFQSYPENPIKRSGVHHTSENIGVVTILPREKSPNKPSAMTRQTLPSMSINPVKGKDIKRINVKHVEIKVDETEIQSEDEGTGIQLTGGQRNDPIETPLPILNDLCSNNQKFYQDRSLNENRVLDWLEQEILKNFLNRLQVDEEPSLIEDNDDWKLLIDVGDDIDPNLIECLTHEVLNEKISAMIYRQQDQDEPVQIQQPIVSPRKSLEFLESHKEKPFVMEVSTPKTSPPTSPRLSRPVEPQVKPVEPTRHEPEYQFINLIQDEETESVLEVTLEESENDELFDNESKSVFIPPTPRETPQPSPEPLETPSISEKTPLPPPPRQKSPPPPKTEQKILINSSVQCDPEPKITPPPLPPPVIIKQIIERPKVEESESELTESSTSYTSDLSTTIDSSKTESESDSYFSDGAWLMSKSEGEIVRYNHSDYVNLDLEAAAKGMILNPRGKKSSDQSEGEIQLDRLNKNSMNAYAGMKPRTGVNQIRIEKELGEVRRNSDKSEGEVENPGLVNKKPDVNESVKSKPKVKKSKKVVSLSVSPVNSKNNIKIKPLVNEIVVRDSNDFERKIFSSTPDTSLFLSNQNQGVDSYDFQIDNSSMNKFIGKNRNSIQISTDFNTTKFDDDDDDTLNNTSDLDQH